MTLQDHKKSKSAFRFEAPEDSPGFLLWQTTIVWQRLIKKELEVHDISHAQFVVMAVTLWFEEHYQEPTQIEIARLSKLDQMTVSKSLKKLVTQGYIRREENQKDTRAKCVHLTSEGKKLISKLIPIVEDVDEKFFRILGYANQEKLIHLLNKIVTDVKE